MPKRDLERRILAKEVGLDGEPIDEATDPGERDRAAAVEGLHRNRAYLGREFLTWVLWASNRGEALCAVEGHDVIVLLTGKVVLRGLAGEATELAVKGHLSAYSSVVRFAIDQGLLVHSARLRIEWNEQVFEVTVDAEHLDVRAALVPPVDAAVAADEGSDEEQLLARLDVCDQVGALLDGLWVAFMEVRTAPKWKRKVVPSMKEWLADPSA